MNSSEFKQISFSSVAALIVAVLTSFATLTLASDKNIALTAQKLDDVTKTTANQMVEISSRVLAVEGRLSTVESRLTGVEIKVSNVEKSLDEVKITLSNIQKDMKTDRDEFMKILLDIKKKP